MSVLNVFIVHENRMFILNIIITPRFANYETILQRRFIISMITLSIEGEGHDIQKSARR